MRILILGGSSKIAQSLTFFFQGGGYEIKIYERKKENIGLDEWIFNVASFDCTIINCIRGQDLRPDIQILEALTKLHFNVNFIHLSSRIVLSKSKRFQRKKIEDCDSDYTRIKLSQEVLYESLTERNPLVKMTILRLGYYCHDIDSIDRGLFMFLGLSKKPRNSILEYITAQHFAENIFAFPEGISEAFEDTVLIEELLSRCRVIFMPRLMFLLLHKLLTLISAHGLRNKVEELMYNGKY